MNQEEIDALADLAKVANPNNAEEEAVRQLRLSAYYGGSLLSKFSRRDEEGVAISRALMEDGDTLVFIKYPGNTTYVDRTGFIHPDFHRVHSSKLIATGSEKFKKLLTDEWTQHRSTKRVGLLGKLPPGVKYILDLTPPDEGDEAIELTSELSCSNGLRSWFLSGDRLNVPDLLVGGSDDVLTPILSPPETSSRSNVSSILATEPDSKIDCNAQLRQTLDYDPIRHRLGIERLLHIIEGKEPRLDSAIKVWTLAVLSKYFDCTSTVVDYIMTWTISEPNYRILEILPETMLRMGLILKNSNITRSAFGILVSEEALKVGAGKPSQLPTHVHVDSTVTRFNRRRESLDEDTVNAIQHAGRSLSDRIEGTIRDLLDPDLTWMNDLEQYAKVRSFKERMYADDELISQLRDELDFVCTSLTKDLRDFVRGRVLATITQPLDFRLEQWAAGNRRSENLFSNFSNPGMNFTSNVYNKLNEHERCCTRFFWLSLTSLDWSAYNGYNTNLIHDYLQNDLFYDTNRNLASSTGICMVTVSDISKAVDDFNVLSCKVLKHQNGKTANNPDVNLVTNGLVDVAFDRSQAQAANGELVGAAEAFSLSPFIVACEFLDGCINVSQLLEEVGAYINGCCCKMLARGEHEWSALCDTLLNLTDDEYKFLPLWAGGLDDGTGGVFEYEMPLAQKGPTGPGPGYHTGSTVNSFTGSDADFDGSSWTEGTVSSETFHTSLAVGDGRSNYDDRREVLSEDDFPMDGTDSFSQIHTGINEDDEDDDSFFFNKDDDLDIYDLSDDGGTSTDRE